MTRFGKFAPLTGRPILALALALSLAPAIARAGSSPTYCHNEATNPGGPSRCGSQATGITQSIPLDVLCDGARTCSKAFFCQGTARQPNPGPVGTPTYCHDELNQPRGTHQVLRTERQPGVRRGANLLPVKTGGGGRLHGQFRPRRPVAVRRPFRLMASKRQLAAWPPTSARGAPLSMKITSALASAVCAGCITRLPAILFSWQRRDDRRNSNASHICRLTLRHGQVRPRNPASDACSHGLPDIKVLGRHARLTLFVPPSR